MGGVVFCVNVAQGAQQLAMFCSLNVRDKAVYTELPALTLMGLNGEFKRLHRFDRCQEDAIPKMTIIYMQIRR